VGRPPRTGSAYQETVLFTYYNGLRGCLPHPHPKSLYMSEYDTLSIDIRDGVATVTLNRPDQMNSFTVQMADDLEAFFTAANDNDEIAAIAKLGGQGFSEAIVVFDDQQGASFFTNDLNWISHFGVSIRVRGQSSVRPFQRPLQSARSATKS